jgi:hypothetical protein
MEVSAVHRRSNDVRWPEWPKPVCTPKAQDSDQDELGGLREIADERVHLLMPQSRYWIDSRRSPGRRITRDHPDYA